MEAHTYKVLFADDEYWTREKMKTIIQWEKYNLEFLPPAENGEEVLEKLEEYHPDILITDINMPYINGVELLQRIHERNTEIVTFVISGYDDFEYVKSSFLSGSINYLVKPVNKIDLVNALSKALEIIGAREKDKLEKEQEELEILKAASLIQDREFSQFLEREKLSFTPAITSNNVHDFAGATMILIKIHDLSELSERYHYDINMVSYVVKKELRQRMKKENVFVFNHIYRANEFIIVTDSDEAEVENAAQRFLVDIGKITTSPVSLVMSDHTYSMGSLQSAYIQTVGLLMTRPFNKQSVILKKDDQMSKEICNRLNDSGKEDMEKFLSMGKGEELKRVISEEIGLGHCQEQNWTYLETKQTVKRVLNLVQEFLVEKKSGREGIVLIDNSIEMIDKALELLDVKYLMELLGDVIDSAVSYGKEEYVGDSMKEIAHQAVAYIEEHYYQPLTLTVLAEQYNVESSYFSKMFRKENGENVMQFIAKTKIAHAKEYMRKSNINLTEIAFMVGYDDYTYFNKVFRKLEGMSPREYRSQIEAGQN